MFRKIFLVMMIVLVGNIADAQTQAYDTTPPYQKTKQMPSFSLLSKDSVVFDQSILQPNKRTILMLFNPECEHCQKQVKLLESMPEVKDSFQIILATTETLQKLNKFYKKFNLSNYPFFIPGKDIHYTFGKFFQPKTIPVLAFYDSKQQFISVYQGQLEKEDILAELKK